MDKIQPHSEQCVFEFAKEDDIYEAKKRHLESLRERYRKMCSVNKNDKRLNKNFSMLVDRCKEL